MLADFYIAMLSNDVKSAVEKNHLGGQILYRSLDPYKKRCHFCEFRPRALWDINTLDIRIKVIKI